MPTQFDLPSAIRHLADLDWSPRIGDPGWLGWLTAGGYLLCALLCIWAARRSDRRRPWLALATIYVALGLNKQLDLQTLLTAVGRQLFRDLGLYDHRRAFQVAFMLIVLLIALAAGLWLWLHLIYAGRGARLAALGAAITVAFVLIRAASFHHVDVLVRVPLGHLPAKGLFENLGTLVSIAGAVFMLSTTKARRRQPADFQSQPQRHE